MSAKGQRQRLDVVVTQHAIPDERTAQGDVPVAVFKPHRQVSHVLVGVEPVVVAEQVFTAGKHVERLDLEVILALNLEVIQLLGVLQVGTPVNAPVTIEVMFVVQAVADARSRDDVVAGRQ